MHIRERFMSKVNTCAHGGCWNWTAYRDKKGYGMFNVGRSAKYAHRVSFEIFVGPIPAGEGYHGTCVCHHCDNPSCVNPSHLFLGANADNVRDMHDKGRAAIGEQNGSAKLTVAQVYAIRADPRTQRVIGEAYGIHQVQVSRIKRHQLWSHIT